MKKIVGFLLVSTFAFAGPRAQNQNPDVSQYYFDTLRVTDIQSTPISVDEMKYIGTQYISHDDSLLMQYATRIVQRDIDFYADFQLIPIDSFFVKLYEIDQIDLLAWMRLGATFLVRLEAEFPGRNMRIRWRLYDVIRRQQFARGKVERKRENWREMAHDIANEVVRHLTGEQGIFRTKVAYVKRIKQAKEIFISDYDGANERQLTSNGSINISPAFSPDGKEIFFTSYVEGDPQLFRLKINNGKVDRIGRFPGIVAAAAVSPDGNKIACVLTKDGNSEIYVLSTKGRVIKRLTRHRAIDSSPTWSPDGDMIAFSSDRTGRPQVYLMDSDGLNQRRLTYQGGYNDSPIWSQRAGRITFVSRTRSGRFDLASIDTSGNDYRVLTEIGMNENPHFSPDGKHIIFSSTRLGRRDIFTMDITGRNQRRLSRKGVCSNPVWQPLK